MSRRHHSFQIILRPKMPIKRENVAHRNGIVNASCVLFLVCPCFVFRMRSAVCGKRGEMKWRLKRRRDVEIEEERRSGAK